MSIEDHLLPRKKEFVQKWFDILASTYPLETVRMLKKESNQFANPVGHTFSVTIAEIFDEFFGQNDMETLGPLLDKIIRIRAIQEFSPSSSLAFIFALKTVGRELLKTELATGQVSPNELLDFEERVDGLALFAFDVYMRCRQDLFDVRMAEVKNRTFRLLQRAQLVAELRPEKSEDS
ncbi:MAG: RsbRD N-terminal domain-containing protein [Syntrophobacteraceae bacterium]